MRAEPAPPQQFAAPGHHSPPHPDHAPPPGARGGVGVVAGYFLTVSLRTLDLAPAMVAVPA